MVHSWGIFHWVLYLVPGNFLVPPRPGFQAIRTITKTWRVNSTDHWLAGEIVITVSLNLRHETQHIYPLDLNQHSQWRIGRNFCLKKRTFLYQPKISCFVVCWGSTDVPLVDSRGADPARAWWGESCVYTFCTLYIFRVYFLFIFLHCNCVLLQLKQSDQISVPPDYIKYVLLYEHVMNLLKKTND